MKHETFSPVIYFSLPVTDSALLFLFFFEIKNTFDILWKAWNSKGSGNNERFISKSLKGVKTLRVTLCFNYMAKEFFCSLNLLFICNNFSVLTMLGDGFTSFSLFLNELKQSQVEKMASDKTIKSISQAQRQSVMKSAWAFYITILSELRQGVTWVQCLIFAWLMLALVSLKPS